MDYILTVSNTSSVSVVQNFPVVTLFHLARPLPLLHLDTSTPSGSFKSTLSSKSYMYTNPALSVSVSSTSINIHVVEGEICVNVHLSGKSYLKKFITAKWSIYMYSATHDGIETGLCNGCNHAAR